MADNVIMPEPGSLYGFTYGTLEFIDSGNSVVGVIETGELFDDFGNHGYAYLVLKKPLVVAAQRGGFPTFGGGQSTLVVGWTGTFDDFAVWSAPSSAGLGNDPATGATLVGANVNSNLSTSNTNWQQNSKSVLPPKGARFVVPTITIPFAAAGSANLDAFNLQPLALTDITGALTGKTVYPYLPPRSLQVNVEAVRTNLSILPRGTAMNAGALVSSQYKTSGPITIAVDATQTWSNLSTAKITINSGAISYSENQSVLVEPGEYLTYSGFYRASTALTGQYAPNIVFFDVNGAQISQTSPTSVIAGQTSGQWVRYSSTVPIPDGAVRAVPYPLVTNVAPTGTDTIWLTGLLLERSTTVGTFFDGSFGGTDYLWSLTTPAGASYGRSYYYPNRPVRTSIMTRIITEALPVQAKMLPPTFANAI